MKRFRDLLKIHNSQKLSLKKKKKKKDDDENADVNAPKVQWPKIVELIQSV